MASSFVTNNLALLWYLVYQSSNACTPHKLAERHINLKSYIGSYTVCEANDRHTGQKVLNQSKPKQSSKLPKPLPGHLPTWHTVQHMCSDVAHCATYAPACRKQSRRTDAADRMLQFCRSKCHRVKHRCRTRLLSTRLAQDPCCCCCCRQQCCCCAFSHNCMRGCLHCPFKTAHARVTNMSKLAQMPLQITHSHVASTLWQRSAAVVQAAAACSGCTSTSTSSPFATLVPWFAAAVPACPLTLLHAMLLAAAGPAR